MLPTMMKDSAFTLIDENGSQAALGGLMNRSPGSETQFVFQLIPDTGEVEGLNIHVERREDVVVATSLAGFAHNGSMTTEAPLKDGDCLGTQGVELIYRSLER